MNLTDLLELTLLYTYQNKCSKLHINHRKGKGLSQQAKVAQGVPGRLRPWILLTFATTKVVGHQSYAPAQEKSLVLNFTG
jgi:hypothetical protein